MELNEFIKQVLINIKKGIQNANDEIGSEVFRIQKGDNSDLIEFDVAVTIDSKKIDSGVGEIKAFVSVFGINLGGKKEDIISNISVSRIKFKITSLLIK